MQKDNFSTPATFEQKLFYPRKCTNCDKSEFTTKQHEIYLTTSMSKIRLPHICKGKNYEISKKNPLLNSLSLLQQNSVKFGVHFTQARKEFTPALLARWNVFSPLLVVELHWKASDTNQATTSSLKTPCLQFYQ